MMKPNMNHVNGNFEDGYSTDSTDASSFCGSFDGSCEDLSQADFGILFDVDGVLARGSTPLAAAIPAFELLKDSEGNLRVPVAFVTNACNRSQDKALQLQTWLNIPVTPEMVIHAPTPAKLLTSFHDKHVLVIGQEHRKEIAEDLGFENICTIEDIQNAYPLLDMVDHENRQKVANHCLTGDADFPKVDAVLLLGEPTKWESNLQLLIDLLLTEGKPTTAPHALKSANQLPIIACNMDLVFMHQACMPRFGHGAFLLCLEALYKKITGRELEYTSLVGKPCEITYRYAEHLIAKIARHIGIHRPIRKLYFVGDNPSVDIVGANLYDRYLKEIWREEDNGNLAFEKLPKSRAIPLHDDLIGHTVRSMDSLLVGTGVYKPEEEQSTQTGSDVYHGHRDIAHEPELKKPTKFVDDVLHGIRHVLETENMLSA